MLSNEAKDEAVKRYDQVLEAHKERGYSVDFLVDHFVLASGERVVIYWGSDEIGRIIPENQNYFQESWDNVRGIG